MTGEVCGHCGFGIKQVSGFWCHTEMAAYQQPRHVPEPLPERVRVMLEKEKMALDRLRGEGND